MGGSVPDGHSLFLDEGRHCEFTISLYDNNILSREVINKIYRLCANNDL